MPIAKEMRRRARKRWRGLAVRYSHKLPGESLLVAIPLAAALGALLRLATLLSAERFRCGFEVA